MGFCLKILCIYAFISKLSTVYSESNLQYYNITLYSENIIFVLFIHDILHSFFSLIYCVQKYIIFIFIQFSIRKLAFLFSYLYIKFMYYIKQNVTSSYCF